MEKKFLFLGVIRTANDEVEILASPTLGGLETVVSAEIYDMVMDGWKNYLGRPFLAEDLNFGMVRDLEEHIGCAVDIFSLDLETLDVSLIDV